MGIWFNETLCLNTNSFCFLFLNFHFVLLLHGETQSSKVLINWKNIGITFFKWRSLQRS